MSAVIVNHEHIHVLIWAASKPIAPPNPTMCWSHDNPTRVNQVEPDGSNRDEIGQILLDENADSVNHLYATPQQVTTTTSGPNTPSGASQNYSTRWTPTPTKLASVPTGNAARRKPSATRCATGSSPNSPATTTGRGPSRPAAPRQPRAAQRPETTHRERRHPPANRTARQRASYTLHPRDRALEELGEEHITSPLGLWNWVGDGLALQGTRRELLTYLRLVIEHVDAKPTRASTKRCAGCTHCAPSAPPPSRPATTPQSRASTSRKSACSTTSPTPQRSSNDLTRNPRTPARPTPTTPGLRAPSFSPAHRRARRAQIWARDEHGVLQASAEATAGPLDQVSSITSRIRHFRSGNLIWTATIATSASDHHHAATKLLHRSWTALLPAARPTRASTHTRSGT